MESCRCCKNQSLKSVLSLGESPLANNLLNDFNEFDEMFPLEVQYCPSCHYCQLSYTVPPEKLFSTYLYTSSTAKSFRDHFEKAAIQYIDEFKLNKNSYVVDIGCNDGIALVPFKNKGINVIGIDPAENIVKLCREKGIDTIHSFFNSDAVDYIITKSGKVDIVTASNVFAHSHEIKDIVKNVFKLLKQDGVFIIEVQYLKDTIKDLTFDNIYHEHVSYWSVTSLNNFFNSFGLSIVKVEHSDTHGGSIRVFIKNKTEDIDDSVQKYLNEEFEFGLTSFNRYEEFAKVIENKKQNIQKNFKALKENNIKIIGYGAPAKATTSLNYFKIDNTYIDYIVEDNTLKHNKIIPGVKIPIFSKSKIELNKPNLIVIMAWNFAKEIKENNKQYINDGIKMVSIKDLQEIDSSLLFDLTS
jgi:SAM-dependent methyltransferase